MNLEQHLLRQMAWSHATFGPGERRAGVTDHLRKEITEVVEGDGDSQEWVDVVILALDGLTRRLAFVNGSRGCPETVAEQACRMIARKQGINEARAWPDWRTADTDKAIEHVRTCGNCGEVLPQGCNGLFRRDGTQCLLNKMDALNSTEGAI